MVDFVTLYRGKTINSARIVAVTAEPAVVRQVAELLLKEYKGIDNADPVMAGIDEARQDALKLIVTDDPSAMEGQLR